MAKKAFTLIEVILVVVIVGVLAGLALPRFLKTAEIQKAAVAKQQLEQIKTTVEFLEVNNKGYNFCPNAGDCDTTEEINAALDLDIHNSDFKFALSKSAGGFWKVEASRVSGSKDYTLDYVLNDDPQIQCSDSGNGACAWINM